MSCIELIFEDSILIVKYDNLTSCIVFLFIYIYIYIYKEEDNAGS